MFHYSSHSPQETKMVGEKLAAGLRGGEIIAFNGGLGAGKTTFCQGIATGLKSIDTVASPTFSIVNLYRGNIPFAHFDAYRINSIHDLETAGFYDYLDQGAVVAVEWSENVLQWLGNGIIKVNITQISEFQRNIDIEGAPWL